MTGAWFSDDEIEVLGDRLAAMTEARREALLRVAGQPGGADQLRRLGLTIPATGAQLLDRPVDVEALQRTVRTKGRK